MAIGFVLCLYKMIDPMKNLINPQDENSCVTHMSKSISYPLAVNRKLTFWTKWRDPWGAATGAHLDVKPQTNIVRVPKKVSVFFCLWMSSPMQTFSASAALFVAWADFLFLRIKLFFCLPLWLSLLTPVFLAAVDIFTPSYIDWGPVWHDTAAPNGRKAYCKHTFPGQ